ncbi:MBL fold metallo-hydrolase RNA specificity domain-containing protein [Desulfococcus sp.]|uniref:MBL fold metallo-hydrolase RNA specificity domain-containing protein n=1 Tax=Desulfococcus sp. TaxID=2025834 RepID=UPI003593E87A
MHITFYGAAREVTGSMHLITSETDRILLDCGMFQGRRKESDRKNRILPFAPEILTNVVLSHAHIDHSGRIPMLVRGGFHGRVVCTRATADACQFLLLDSAYIQESDANYLNYKTVRASLSRLRSGATSRQISNREMDEIKALLKKDRHGLNLDAINELMRKYRLESVEPLYTIAEAEASLSSFDGYPYGHPVTIGTNATCTFYEAGHILGSAFSIIKARENGAEYTIGYTGDIGRFDKPILKDPTLKFREADRNLDLLVMESTYGNRLHEPVEDLKPQLKRVLQETWDRRGTVIIPSFAFGRTQELIYVLHELYDSGEIQRVPVYIDSPLGIKLTQVFGEHPEVYDEETQKTFLKKGKNPFSFGQIRFVQSVEDSMKLMQETQPHIVIASSGMCEGGRILHHLRYKIHNPSNTILIVGYMAQHTLGRRILEQGEAYEASGRSGAAPVVRFLNKEYPLKAYVTKIGGFSGHGDRNEMLRFLRESNLIIKRIAVVHGEEDQAKAFADSLSAEGYPVTLPYQGQSIWIR